MGTTACRVALEFLRSATTTEVIMDPFCGHGTVLAAANAMGFDAIGVDIGAKRCRAARTLRLDAELCPVATVRSPETPPGTLR